MRNKFLIVTALIGIALLNLNFNYAVINGKNVNDIDEYLINDKEIYSELFNRKFNYNKDHKDEIEDDWNYFEEQKPREEYRRRADGFKYDFFNDYIYNQNESIPYTDEIGTYAYKDEEAFCNIIK